jgi:crotonobetainyl-CoA:carnitine CoA-transferase CaiB-like acyl-CoA transferase
MMPFENMRVADLTTMIAGAGVCRELADLGAEVIKIEPFDGDPWRTVSAGFMGVNRGKRSVVIDLGKEEARPIAYKIISTCDIMVENSRPGVMSKLGMDYESIQQFKPDIIYVSCTAFGSRGAHARQPGYDPLFQAMSGQMAGQGGPGNVPIYHRISLNDEMVPMLGAFGAAAAVFHKLRTGRGQHLETSLLNSSIMLQSAQFIDYKGMKRRYVGRPDIKGLSATNRLYQGIDGKSFYIYCATEEHWKSMCSVINMEDLALDPRFVTPALRRKNDTELTLILKEIFSTTPAGMWASMLVSQGVPAGAAQSLDDILRFDAHCKETGVFVQHEHAQFGKVQVQGVVPIFSETPGSVRRLAPLLGEHTREVLLEIGYSNELIGEFLAKKLVA